MATRTEIRSFRGKDITVIFSEYGAEKIYKKVEVNLTIDGHKFISYGYKASEEEAYEQAICFLTFNLKKHAKGNLVEYAKDELSVSQQYLVKCQQKQAVAQWFLNFTKER